MTIDHYNVTIPMYFLEHEENKVLITIDDRKQIGHIHLRYPQRERYLTSGIFQLSLMEAFIEQSPEVEVEMDDYCQNFWDTRPESFRNRKSKQQEYDGSCYSEDDQDW